MPLQFRTQAPPKYGAPTAPTTAPPPRALTTTAGPTVAKWPTTAPRSIGGSNGIGNSTWNTAPRTPQTQKPEQDNTPATGTQSGPGILENWFGQRASGTDPGYEYALGRSTDALNNAYAAGGSFNSGARTQGLSDMYANMEAQREGQLDELAAGASGEHQGRVNSMFQQMLGLAGGQSGINTSYDLAAGSALSDALKAALGFGTNKAGVDSQADQAGIRNLFGLGGLITGFGGGSAGSAPAKM